MSELVEVALFTDDVKTAKSFYGKLFAAPPESEWPGGAMYVAGVARRTCATPMGDSSSSVRSARSWRKTSHELDYGREPP